MVSQGELALTQVDTLPVEVASDSVSKAEIPSSVTNILSGQEISEEVTAADSIVNPEEPQYAILLTPSPHNEPAPVRDSSQTGISFILCGLFLLFFITALRFRNNMKYATTLFKSLVETRTRHNVFDDTVRETSIIVLLNILWCACAGVILYSILCSFGVTGFSAVKETGAIFTCMSGAAVYTCFMGIAYFCTGWVFSDTLHAKMWVKGFGASQGLMTPFFFIIALLALSNPNMDFNVTVSAAFVYIIVKLIFIWKGYRIFFNQFSSWVLFLCYLCSLEIVPLILTYRLVSLLGPKFF